MKENPEIKSVSAVQPAKRRNLVSYVFTLLLLIAFIAFLVYRGRDSEGKPPSSRVAIGKDFVYYSGSATRENARALGEALKDAAFFVNRGVDAILWRGEAGTVVSIVCNTGTWDDRELILKYEELGRRIAPTVGGYPITVRLLDNHGRARRNIGVGLFISGANDRIYYFGRATSADAQALAELFKANQYFVGSGGMVLLSREDSLTVSYVVNARAWTQPQFYASFQNLTRQAALNLGGLPVTFRLLNSSMETQRQLLLQ